MECSICFENCDDCVTTQCNHTFCSTCITTWKSVKNTCPCCRQFLIIQSCKQAENEKKEYIPTIQYARTIHSTAPDSLDQITTKLIILVWNQSNIDAATTYANAQKLKVNENAIIYVTRNNLTDSQMKELEIIHNCSKIVYYSF